jgi:hypothetical protein
MFTSAGVVVQVRKHRKSAIAVAANISLEQLERGMLVAIMAAVAIALFYVLEMPLPKSETQGLVKFLTLIEAFLVFCYIRIRPRNTD